ncbi:MAG: hypothetical protein ACLFRY_01955 [Spirochaetia bacterium]
MKRFPSRFRKSFPYTVGYGRKAVESGDFSGLVAYFNALETEMFDLFPEMETSGMGFIGIRPFAVQFALSDSRIASTVVGINTPKELRSAEEAVNKGPLDPDIVQKPHEMCTRFRDRFGVKANTAGVPVY